MPTLIKKSNKNVKQRSEIAQLGNELNLKVWFQGRLNFTASVTSWRLTRSVSDTRSIWWGTAIAELGTDGTRVRMYRCVLPELRPLQLQQRSHRRVRTRANASGDSSTPLWCGRVAEGQRLTMMHCSGRAEKLILLLMAVQIRQCCSSLIWTAPDYRSTDQLCNNVVEATPYSRLL